MTILSPEVRLPEGEIPQPKIILPILEVVKVIVIVEFIILVIFLIILWVGFGPALPVFVTLVTLFCFSGFVVIILLLIAIKRNNPSFVLPFLVWKYLELIIRICFFGYTIFFTVFYQKVFDEELEDFFLTTSILLLIIILCGIFSIVVAHIARKYLNSLKNHLGGISAQYTASANCNEYAQHFPSSNPRAQSNPYASADVMMIFNYKKNEQNTRINPQSQQAPPRNQEVNPSSSSPSSTENIYEEPDKYEEPPPAYDTLKHI